MRRVARENALCTFMAACGCATMGWLGLYGFAWNDYEVEARPAFDALVQGHIAKFLSLAPVYGGSLIERAPFALLPDLWGGGDLAVYRMAAVPCLLAAAALGVYVVADMRSRGHTTLARAIALALFVANPITLLALELGHPEDLLGASLCVAAVLLACGAANGRERPLLAGVALGLAIANKEWALLAAGPVLLALPGNQRLRCVAAAAASTAVILAPLTLASSGNFVASSRGVAAPSTTIFQPWQLWWFLGHHGALVHGAFGVAKPGYRIPPAWAGELSHPLILLLALVIPGLLWLRSRRLARREALLALALVMLLRCLLDTWDTAYYPLPFLFALLVWELQGSALRPPLLTLSATVLVWASFQWLPLHGSPDVQAAFFLAWSLPLTVWLGLRLAAATAHSSPGEHPTRPQEMTVSSLGRLVSTS